MAFLVDLLPSQCLLCSRLAARCCSNCQSKIGNRPRLVFRQGLIGFAADSYSSDAKIMLRSFKELGESSLARFLSEPMAGLIDCFAEVPNFVVPVPSSKTAFRERGYNPAELLAREICRIRKGISLQNGLTRTRKVVDQSKLSPAARNLNQANSMVFLGQPGSVILVDDIVTTGSTLLEAARAINQSGNQLLGFVTFAETESKKV